MSTPLFLRLARLHVKLAAAEDVAAGIRAKIEALTGEAVPVAGEAAKPAAKKAPVVDITPLWDAALKISRTRSSKQQCRAAWRLIPAGERPTMEEAVAALIKWNRSEEWTRDACLYARGLHLFIKNRLWEDVPEVTEAPSRTPRKRPEPAPAPPAEDLASPEDQAEIFASIKLA